MILNYSDWKRLYEQSSYGANPENQEMLEFARMLDERAEPLNVPIVRPGQIAILASNESKPEQNTSLLSYTIYYFNASALTTTGRSATFEVTHTSDQYVPLNSTQPLPTGYTVSPDGTTKSMGAQVSTQTLSLTEAYMGIAGAMQALNMQYSPETYANALDVVSPGLKASLISSLRNGQGVWNAFKGNPDPYFSDPNYKAIDAWADTQS